MATDKTSAPVSGGFRRAGEFDTFGKSLEAILDKDVILRKYSVTERGLRDRDNPGNKEDRTFVLIWINEVDDENGTQQLFHAWSEDLANKMAQIPDDALPLLIKFRRIPTAGGYKVYTFE